MEKLSKQFEELVTKWKASFKRDEFFVARLRLTFYYSLTAIIILGGSSLILYNVILSNLTQSINENILLGPDISQAILDNAQDILRSRFLTIDAILIFFIIILGFLLTQKTLQPIKTNMEKQKRFIADASHELRTPVAVAISGLEVTLSNKNLDLPLAKKTLENTLVEMRDFSLLSNHLLDISKYDAQVKFKHEPFSINELVKSIGEKMRHLAKDKSINLIMKLEFEATIKGNKMELGRVFYNILDNAVKYTPQNGTIEITDKISSNKYIVTISDTGSGISTETMNKIFDPFFRGDASRQAGGAGLGLTLAKKIIENHNGSIVVRSEIGKGTSFIISLPISS